MPRVTSNSPVPFQQLVEIRSAQVGVGDRAVGNPEPVLERLDPAGLLHRILGADGGLHVHDALDSLKARLRNEIVAQ